MKRIIKPGRKWVEKKRYIFLLVFLFLAFIVQILKWTVGDLPDNKVKPVINNKPDNLSNSIDYNSNAQAVSKTTYYNIYEQEIDEGKIRTLIKRKLYISSGQYDSLLIAQILRQSYKDAQNVKGLKYHNPATNYQIELFADLESAESGYHSLGVLNKVNDRPVTYQIYEEVIYSTQKPIHKFGLLESKRKAIFKQTVLLERKYGYDTPELQAAHLKLANKEGIKMAVLDSIILEGFFNPDWIVPR